MRNVYKILFVFLTFFIGFSCAKADELIEGVYSIETMSGKAVEADSENVLNGTNIQINEKKSTNNQKWILKKIDNGYYQILSSVNDKFAFDVKWGSHANGTNVWAYENNKSYSQGWYLRETSDGYYNIISRCNGLYLDVSGGSSANGANIQVWQNNGSDAQKFKLIEDIKPTRTIEDGSYIIHTSNYNQVIDLSGYGTNNFNNIQTYNYQLFDCSAQIWNVKYLNDGYYSITTSINDKKNMDLLGGLEVSGMNVQIYDSNGADAQKWIIKEAGDGYYYIITPNNHKYLDVPGGNAYNGANIQVWRGNGAYAQKFKFEKYESKPLEEGFYSISSALDNNKVLSLDRDVAITGGNIHLWTNMNSNNQKWFVKPLGNGIYSISSSLNLYKMMDVYGASPNNGANVQVWDDNGLNAQRWYIKYVGDGYYSILSQISGKSVDVTGYNTKDGTNIQMYDTSYNNAQKFKFTKTEKNFYTKSYDDGYYQIASLLDESKLLDASGAFAFDGNNVQIWGNNGSNAQIWHLEYLKDGYYKITSALNRNVSLDVYGLGMYNGTNVGLWRNLGNDGQQWLIKDYGDGTVGIVSKQNGLYLDVAGGGTANGTNVQMYSGNGSNAQKFKLIKNNTKKIYHGIDVSKYQNDIDWYSVSRSGVNFAIIRAGFGGNQENQDDAKMLRNIEYCEKYNIPYALYLYSYARNTNESFGSKENPIVPGGSYDEANHMIRILNSLKSKGHTPNLSTQVFIDMEEPAVADSGKDNLTQVADTFCSVMNNNGYSCGVYSNTNWLNFNLDSNYLSSKYAIWYSWYFPKQNPNFWDAHGWLSEAHGRYNNFKYWQFASDGIIDGIYGNVDVNLGYDIFD